jgi:hypothetical protein
MRGGLEDDSKGAICLRLTGRTGKTDNHASALNELTAAGPQGAALESTFRRLLSLKTKSQNQGSSFSASDGRRSVEQATKMLEVATRVAAN